MWEYIGYIAATLGAISLVPEVIKALRTHHLQDLAWGMLFLMFSSTICWGLYAINSRDIPLMMSSTINLSMEIMLTTLKLRYNSRKSLEPAGEEPIKTKTRYSTETASA